MTLARDSRASLLRLVALGVICGGLALVSRELLAGPESAARDRAAVEGDRSLLRIRNKTPFIVIVYVAGVRVGWIRPHRIGLIRGLVSGYHRVYALSQHGTVSWGPQFVWVPGTWNLRQ
jgi:hypothetical protein